MRPFRIPACPWPEALAGGKERQRLKELTRSSPRRNPHKTYEENVLGWMGEHCISRYFDVPLVGVFDDRGRGDDGYDARVGRWRVDIKACRKRPYFLPVKDSTLWKGTTQAFVLVWCPWLEPSAYIVGSIGLWRALRYPSVPNCYEPDNKHPKEYIPGKCIPVDDLATGEVFVQWAHRQLDFTRTLRRDA